MQRDRFPLPRLQTRLTCTQQLTHNGWLCAQIVVPMVNKILATGFPLPSMGGLTLTNSAVRTVDNAIVVASDFKLNLDIFDDQAPQR